MYPFSTLFLLWEGKERNISRCPGALSTTCRRAGTDCPKPCSSAGTCLAAGPVAGLHVPRDWWPTRTWLHPCSPSTLGCLPSLSEKSPPQSGHASSPLLCSVSLSLAHSDSTGARLFLPSPFGNSRLPSSHISSGAGRPAKCHTRHVAPGPAFDVTFRGVTAPAGPGAA